ncbi:hypothetical protein HK105_204339 [Polyrhizophydium stewartii]|uniref:Uncharacterized protein n=1 Tax=Polyrhizophydium stewartii TaxID=2732419 RepID=A0ABR4N9R1_9FUNG
MDTFTDIAYIKEKNAIQITGESHDDVYKAQSQLNTLFFPVIVKSKKQWARPDRPGNWGQRRDSNGGSQGLRRMRSEPSFNKQQQQQPQFAQPQQPQQHYHQHDDRVVPGSSDHQSRRSSGSVHGHGHGHVHHRTSFQSAFSSSSSGGSNRLSTHSSGSYAPSAQWR